MTKLTSALALTHVKVHSNQVHIKITNNNLIIIEIGAEQFIRSISSKVILFTQVRKRKGEQAKGKEKLAMKIKIVTAKEVDAEAKKKKVKYIDCPI